jgi:hypothetical protein
MARLSGGPKSITANINHREWIKQADIYDSLYNDGMWNKTLQMYAIAEASHPFSAVRVREVFKWSESDQYRRLKTLMLNSPGSICPSCKSAVDSTWKFCKYCGHKL